MKKKIMRRILTLLAALVMCVLAAGVASATEYYGDTKFPTFDEYEGCEFTDVYTDNSGTIWYYDEYYAEELLDYRDYLIFDLGFKWAVYEDDYDGDGSEYARVRENVVIDPKNNYTLTLWDFDDSEDPWIGVELHDSSYENDSLSIPTSKINMKVSGGTQSILVTALDDSSHGLVSRLDNTDVVDTEWDEWDNDKINLNITPKKAGVAHIVIYGKNTGETVWLTINVSSNTTQKVSKKLPSATKYKADPNLGSGTWKTSNSSIVSLSKKKGSTCTFTLKKAGKAKVTFKSSLGTYVYNITVYNKKSDPLRAGFIEMDSVGGIEPTIFIANTSSKTIKYVDFKVTFYNAVGDKVQNEIGYGYTKNLQIIGPIKPWTMDYFKWDPVFYNGVAKRMYVKSATVTYMNGSKKTFSIKKSFSFSTTEADKYYKYC